MLCLACLGEFLICTLDTWDGGVENGSNERSSKSNRGSMLTGKYFLKNQQQATTHPHTHIDRHSPGLGYWPGCAVMFNDTNYSAFLLLRDDWSVCSKLGLQQSLYKSRMRFQFERASVRLWVVILVQCKKNPLGLVFKSFIHQIPVCWLLDGPSQPPDVPLFLFFCLQISED